eukprot:CAMPEP_0115013510 /NCGR_PEP_ID=MMETSP0216-20121206/25457_1 /TAXON_ID=223996 /ORGANISM="Protocruzia adherens, Strain Boccale" /LENGTH=385 /DNA_ID=CAMNT_0002382935 /DNA_START=25 /DNA_END=1181 /DNA_ORIENTATION=-
MSEISHWESKWSELCKTVSDPETPAKPLSDPETPDYFVFEQIETRIDELIQSREIWEKSFAPRFILESCDGKACPRGGQIVPIKCSAAHSLCVQCLAAAVSHDDRDEYSYSVRCPICLDEKLIDFPPLENHLSREIASEIDNELNNPKIKETVTNLQRFKKDYLDENFPGWSNDPNLTITFDVSGETIAIKCEGRRNAVRTMKNFITNSLQDVFTLLSMPCESENFPLINDSFRQKMRSKYFCDIVPIACESSDVIIEGAVDIEPYLEYYGPITSFEDVKEEIKKLVEESVKTKSITLTEESKERINIDDIYEKLTGPQSSLRFEGNKLILRSRADSITQDWKKVQQAIMELSEKMDNEEKKADEEKENEQHDDSDEDEDEDDKI